MVVVVAAGVVVVVCGVFLFYVILTPMGVQSCRCASMDLIRKVRGLTPPRMALCTVKAPERGTLFLSMPTFFRPTFLGGASSTR